MAHVATQLHALGDLEVVWVEVIAERDDPSYGRGTQGGDHPLQHRQLVHRRGPQARHDQRLAVVGSRRAPSGIGAGRLEEGPDVADRHGSLGGREVERLRTRHQHQRGPVEQRAERLDRRHAELRPHLVEAVDRDRHAHRVEAAGGVEVGGVQRVDERDDRDVGGLAGGERGGEHVVGHDEVDLAGFLEDVGGQRARVPLLQQRTSDERDALRLEATGQRLGADAPHVVAALGELRRQCDGRRDVAAPRPRDHQDARHRRNLPAGRHHFAMTSSAKRSMPSTLPARSASAPA